MRSAARASMGARRAWDEEPAGVSDGVAVRPSRRIEGCSDDACCSFPAGLMAAWAAGDGKRRGAPPTGAVWATWAARAARRSARARCASAMETMKQWGAGRRKEASAHPYLARQMSDHGFRQNPQGLNTGACAKISSLLIHALAL